MILELDHGDGAAITVAKINHGGRTALHYAAGGGQFHICKYLIDELKLDVNMKDEEGMFSLLMKLNMHICVFIHYNYILSALSSASLFCLSEKNLTIAHSIGVLMCCIMYLAILTRYLAVQT